MPFCFSPLRSGSSGNTLLVQAGGLRVLVDAGLSCRAIECALSECAVTPDTLGAVLITHEHSDHVKGLALFAKKYNLPVYMTEGTWNAVEGMTGFDKIPLKNRRAVEPGLGFYLRDLFVTPFAIPHDAAEPVGYSFQFGARKLCVATDLGHIAKGWMNALSGANLALLESNHDPALLRAHPRYPARLKARILGRRGHLSNEDCGSAIVELARAGLTNVILGHLSAETNRPELAQETVEAALCGAGIRPGEDVRVTLAHRDRNGGIYFIE